MKKGVQAKGFVYTVAAGDAFKLALHGYEGTDTPSPGDKVHVIGRVPLTKARCARPAPASPTATAPSTSAGS